MCLLIGVSLFAAACMAAHTGLSPTSQYSSTTPGAAAEMTRVREITLGSSGRPGWPFGASIPETDG